MAIAKKLFGVAKKCIYLIIPFILFAGILELGAMIFLSSELHTMGASPAYMKSLAKYPHNQSGYRGPDYSKRKENKNSYRIIVLGDSVSFGQGVFTDAFIWPFRMESILNGKHSDRKYEVLNFSQNGWSTEDEYNAYALNGGSEWEHDLVVIAYYFNDATEQLAQLKSFLPDVVDQWLVPWSYFYYFLKSRYNVLLIRSGSIPGYDQWMKDLYNENAPELKTHYQTLKKLVGEIQRHKAKCIIVLMPPLVHLQDSFFDEPVRVVTGFGASLGVRVCDLRRQVGSATSDPRSLWVNGYDMHPNEQGHKILARSIAEIVDQESAP